MGQAVILEAYEAQARMVCAMTSWWLSCSKFTVQVEADDEQIVRKAAPIVHRFIGQPMHRLVGWASKLGDFKIVQLRGGDVH